MTAAQIKCAAKRARDYDFKQEIYGVISLYMDALSPNEIATALREIADEESERTQ